MLILQRKAGEALLIGDEITVSVVAVEGNRVRLAITAPDHVPILRSELVKATAANQDSAAADNASPDALLALFGGLLVPDESHPHPTLLTQEH